MNLNHSEKQLLFPADIEYVILDFLVRLRLQDSEIKCRSRGPVQVQLFFWERQRAVREVIAGSAMITTPGINDSRRGRWNISFNGALETPQGAPRGQVGITSRDNGGVFSPFDHLVKFLPREGSARARAPYGTQRQLFV